MSRFSIFVMCLVVMGMVSELSAATFPDYLDLYRDDIYRKADVDGCIVCHVSPNGGGANNSFGFDFFDSGERITSLLRANYPDRFDYPKSAIEGVTVHFSDPEGKEIVLEISGRKYRVDVESQTIPELPLNEPFNNSKASNPAGIRNTLNVAVKEIPVDEFAYEGAFFGSRIVNLPNAKPVGPGGIEFMIGHRFNMPLFTRDSPKFLFGFDSSAFVTFGVQMGVTDWMSIEAMRSNLDRTIELSSALQLSRQRESVPLSTQFRFGVEGRRNFTERFSPFLQFIAVRSFGGRISLALAPTIAFNTRNEQSFLRSQFLFGYEHDYTASLGLAAGLKLTPTVSLVGEYIPRMKGFKGELFDRPAVSVGIQKSTYRHTFEFVMSTAKALTTAQYSLNGSDAFKVGFNIYRRLR